MEQIRIPMDVSNQQIQDVLKLTSQRDQRTVQSSVRQPSVTEFRESNPNTNVKQQDSIVQESVTTQIQEQNK